MEWTSSGLRAQPLSQQLPVEPQQPGPPRSAEECPDCLENSVSQSLLLQPHEGWPAFDSQLGRDQPGPIPPSEKRKDLLARILL